MPDSQIINLPAELGQHAPVTQAPLQRHVFVCTGSSCCNNGSEATMEKFREVLKDCGLLYGKKGSMDGTVLLTTCGSIGLCKIGPAVLVYPDGVWYHGVKPEDVPELVDSHLINNQPLERLLAKKFK